MLAVEPLKLFFAPHLIINDIRKIISADVSFDEEKFKNANQISLRTEDWFCGIGSLYDSQTRALGSTSEFIITNSKLSESYISTVIGKVEELAHTEGVKIGRIRIMRLSPKTCLSLHTDESEWRYHVPLETNRRCFFVVDNVVHRMPQAGRLYRFKTDAEHTAVNASMEPRVHLLFDTYG